MKTHILGFSRTGLNRELKFATEKYWDTQSKYDETKLIKIKQNFCKNNWKKQIKSGLNYITVGDFSYYDHVLTTMVYFNCIPSRFNFDIKNFTLKEYFELARGNADSSPLEMRKWFNTNYHYLVPEYDSYINFNDINNWLYYDIKRAKKLKKPIKAVILGPISLLKLGKSSDPKLKNRLLLLPDLILTYLNFISKLNSLNVKIIQIEEPVMSFDLSSTWITCLKNTYNLFLSYHSNIMLTTYFEYFENFKIFKVIPIKKIHLNINNNNQVKSLISTLPKYKMISIGIIEGNNIWKNNLERSYYIIKNINSKFKNILLSTSTSLMHIPVDVKDEKFLNKDIKNWISFGLQKIEELIILKNLFLKKKKISKDFLKNIYFTEEKKKSELIFDKKLQNLLKNINILNFSHKLDYNIRKKYQKKYINLPILPTTTIGSFPQTPSIRRSRYNLKKNLINYFEYENIINEEIKFSINKQLDYNLDVLVHGEFERNDMVEYFSDFFYGMLNTSNGWVQSYGSRYVKPPIIYGDLYIKNFITSKWINYSQNLTIKPLKGMLTGPITMFKWSFSRNDQPNYITSLQFSLNLREEVKNLEDNGANIIQIDEPALKEALPLKKNNYNKYFNWAIKSFLFSSNNTKITTQIHTHICYSEFNSIISNILKLDADVISIETARSGFEILPFLLKYSNDIGLGIYDIHSKRKLKFGKAIYLLKLILIYIDEEKVWINPDCGLKTRKWEDIEISLINMTKSANILKKCLSF